MFSILSSDVQPQKSRTSKNRTSMVKTATNHEVPEVMPSYFQSIQSTESHPLNSWESLRNFIVSDPVIKRSTDFYRQRLQISKKYADELKPLGAAITISAQMDGYGKKLENFVKPTYCLMVEFDKVPTDQMEHIKQLITQDEYTMVCHRSISGRGFHIFCKYDPYDDEDISILELFGLMIEKAQLHYDQLLGLACDKGCCDITRNAGLAHDPEAYFNWKSTPFTLDHGDVKKIYIKKASEAKYRKRPGPKSKKAQQQSAKFAPITIEEVDSQLSELLRQWGYDFEPGRHNEYVFHWAKCCVRYGIAQEEALQFADAKFGTNYPDTAAVVKSCYKHTEQFGTWHFYRKGEGYSSRPTVKTIKQWLSTHYDFQRNIVTGFYELRSKMVYTGKFLKFTRIDDNIENSLWAEMNEAGLYVSDRTLNSIINSDFSTPFNPLEEYLKSLPKWTKGEDPDYIDQLADRIQVADKPDYEHTQADFRYYFKKWLVAMVVAWLVAKVVNQFILIFVGKGGIFKTTFFAYLLPPSLREYFLNDSTANYTDKDFMEAFASKALLCLDEFETVFGKNLSAFKSNITKLTFSIRRPYDKYRSELPHRGSLCGTTNSQQFISDEENRRYSPWIVQSIESPIEHPIDYDHVYAEALALGQEVMKGEKGSGHAWTFWLTRADIEQMRVHNRLFMVANYAEEQILKYYRVPTPDTDIRFIKFRYTSEILEKIGVNPALRQNLNSHNIGSIMSRLGFKKIHKAQGNGWAVIEKEVTELNSDSAISPTDTVED